jgi:hypothetical protein
MNNKAIRDLVLDDQGSIAQVIQCCAFMEQTYLHLGRTAQMEPQTELRNVLVELYMKILLYHVKAFAFIKESKLGKQWPTDHHEYLENFAKLESSFSDIRVCPESDQDSA